MAFGGESVGIEIVKKVPSNADLIAVRDEAGNFNSKNVEGVLAELAGFHKPKYGVTGVGGSLTTLTRLWDSIGKTANVGTDTQKAVNHFDILPPFNRRKCVGDWAVINGKGVFTVNSYYGDPDFAEDGSMGNYVAVEIDPLWYYQDDFSLTAPDEISGTIGVSPSWIFGWKPHPICLNDDGTIREKTYLPCYSLAMKNGMAVSLPGYHPEFGDFKTLWDAARTYNEIAVLEPSIVRHYEWLLITIEYATTNAQSVMAGATNMPYSASDTISLAAENTNSVVVTNAIGEKFTVGQTIYLGDTYSATPANVGAYNVITDVKKCDADGTPNDSGAYYKITFDGDARTVTTSTTISSRPWKTGSCSAVLTPSGVPCGSGDPKTADKLPMRYRYRENIWGNQYSTCGDLFPKLAGSGTGEDPYYIEWYYLVNKSYYPVNTSKPDAADLATAAFIKLSQKTEHVSGYIKTINMDKRYPCVITPTVQTGGSAGTYYADYAYIVNGTVGVRAVRFGGAVSATTAAGPLYFHALHPPAYASWLFGAGLYIPQ
jgi:hypothetical protein